MIDWWLPLEKRRGETYANLTSWHSNEPFVGNFSTFDWTLREICMKDLSFENGEYSMNVFTGPLKGRWSLEKDWPTFQPPLATSLFPCHLPTILNCFKSDIMYYLNIKEYFRRPSFAHSICAMCIFGLNPFHKLIEVKILFYRRNLGQW